MAGGVAGGGSSECPLTARWTSSANKDCPRAKRVMLKRQGRQHCNCNSSVRHSLHHRRKRRGNESNDVFCVMGSLTDLDFRPKRVKSNAFRREIARNQFRPKARRECVTRSPVSR